MNDCAMNWVLDEVDPRGYRLTRAYSGKLKGILKGKLKGKEVKIKGKLKGKLKGKR